MKKFEVGERVQFIEGNEVKTGKVLETWTGKAYQVETKEGKSIILGESRIAKLSKPEPVKVPKETADFIKTYGSSNDSYSVLATIMKDIIDCYDPDTDDLFIENLDKNIQAVLNGYVVEEEKKYYVKIVYTAGGFLNLQTERDGSFCYRLRGASEPEGYKTKFTETEIKAIDERLWTFAVPVEEVEASE
ncbi:DUF1642 domain-containing protein [Listeria monocytogenes]|uniref:DUF1642 domain-containing protein n=1 Tax=Listeria monocytogenes TaxID=1639 RepID=UPI0018CC86C9|nr:DUF1642 domain-containing protein [Listeria monocytogenes]MBH0214341.1 DUF1642 domain-containing protein [Listeria monocytogenes]